MPSTQIHGDGSPSRTGRLTAFPKVLTEGLGARVAVKTILGTSAASAHWTTPNDQALGSCAKVGRRSLRCSQQLRQLSNIHSDAPRLIERQHLGAGGIHRRSQPNQTDADRYPFGNNPTSQRMSMPAMNTQPAMPQFLHEIQPKELPKLR